MLYYMALTSQLTRGSATFALAPNVPTSSELTSVSLLGIHCWLSDYG